MRIQHNITAMNSYRNFSANTSNLSKNLEKLSSGYKINRAGDDAAGLAISEKMRAQITGLEGATKNSKDGISLIQTAEGALTEVHDMLNRMTTLAEQSANGTYQNELDREQLQKEVSQLKEEIDRIADSTNFNGLKLLDGSLTNQGVPATLSERVNATDYTATKNVTTTDNAWTVNSTAAAADKKLTLSVAWQEADGTEYSKEITLTTKLGSGLGDDYTATDFYLVGDDGTVYDGTGQHGTAAAAISVEGVQKAVISELNKDENFAAAFDAQIGDAGKFKFTSKKDGTEGATITGFDVTAFDEEILASAADAYTNTPGIDAGQKLDLSKVGVLAGTTTTSDGYTARALEKSIFEVDGNKFVMVGSGANQAGINALRGALDADVNIIQITGQAGADNGGTGFALNNTDSARVAADLTRVTGKNFSVASDPHPDTISYAQYDILYQGDEKLTNEDTFKAGGLSLQIGDTSDSFNKLTVSVGDMHSEAIGIGDVDISTQEGASKALDKIKTAINNVSDTRGTLGSLQNRLEHTINNLGVQRENIQNAESLIRDTDVAEEMMTYTKNNILNQSAQAMLAQANQLPQGVLQLLG